MTDSAADQAPQGSPFWRFSLAFYRDGEVAKACLDLQDGCGVDVNLLLFLLWLARARRVLPAAELHALDEKLAHWRREAVVPLRSMRRALKAGDALVGPEQAAFFRTRVKALELEAERLQQEAMFALSDTLATATGASPDEAARANLNAYASVKGAAFNRGAVDVLLAALARH